MTAMEPVRAKSPDHELELDEYLREEYTFRHDLIWRLLFRVTVVAALVSIVPFTMSDTAASRAGGLVKFLPALAIGLVLVSWIVTLVELHLFRHSHPSSSPFRDPSGCFMSVGVRHALDRRRRAWRLRFR